VKKLLAGALIAHWVLEGAILVGLGLVAWGSEPPTVRVDPIVVPPPAVVDELAARMGGSLEIADAIRRHGPGYEWYTEDLVVGIIRKENPWLLTDTVNSYGATGLMQVWDFHLGDHPECGDVLADVDTNICYGLKLFDRKWHAAGGDMTLALLFYNGCWGSTYILGCESYPADVVERGEI